MCDAAQWAGTCEKTIDQLFALNRESYTYFLEYEDKLPEMTDAEYGEWFKHSRVIDGVRMGPMP